MEGFVETFEEKSFLKRPTLWIFLVVDIPHFGDELVADDARVTDKGADAEGTEGWQGIALSDIRTGRLVVVATSRQQ